MLAHVALNDVSRHAEQLWKAVQECGLHSAMVVGIVAFLAVVSLIAVIIERRRASREERVSTFELETVFTEEWSHTHRRFRRRQWSRLTICSPGLFWAWARWKNSSGFGKLDLRLVAAVAGVGSALVGADTVRIALELVLLLILLVILRLQAHH